MREMLGNVVSVAARLLREPRSRGLVVAVLLSIVTGPCLAQGSSEYVVPEGYTRSYYQQEVDGKVYFKENGPECRGIVEYPSTSGSTIRKSVDDIVLCSERNYAGPNRPLANYLLKSCRIRSEEGALIIVPFSSADSLEIKDFVHVSPGGQKTKWLRSLVVLYQGENTLSGKICGLPDLDESNLEFKGRVRVAGTNTDKDVRIYGVSKIIFTQSGGTDAHQYSANAGPRFSEARVRYIMADMALGGPVEYYRSARDDANAVEAIRRRGNDFFVTNKTRFERLVEDGTPRIVYKGTHDVINGMDVGLSCDLQH
jgi:hypothetical protein